MSLYVGIDVGKFHHVACFLDEGETKLSFSSLETVIRDLVSLRSSLKDSPL